MEAEWLEVNEFMWWEVLVVRDEKTGEEEHLDLVYDDDGENVAVWIVLPPDLPREKLNLDLSRLDGNAFILMGAFKGVAKNAWWTDEQIKIVLTEAKKWNYDHLVETLATYCE